MKSSEKNTFLKKFRVSASLGPSRSWNRVQERKNDSNDVLYLIFFLIHSPSRTITCRRNIQGDEGV